MLLSKPAEEKQNGTRHQEDEQKSLELLHRLLIDPLEARLKKIEGLKGLDVQVSPETRQLDRIETEEQQKENEDDPVYEDGPFFGTNISWWIRLRDPPTPEEKSDSAEAGK